ncbi:C-Jun-amino-terminal kinase-interacting protein 3-like isoform X2 [Symsagittifera roscoffensis]|uniref:C-Jun-amino-terminal kinase-interacting protein 3-like isoform X2 n=1 Tax=Symsagittifera roscoffensis TaxID=84072 RepID=UPI00307BC022
MENIESDYGMFDSPIKTPSSNESQHELDQRRSFQSTEDLHDRGGGLPNNFGGLNSMLGSETIFSTNSLDGLDLTDTNSLGFGISNSRPGSSMRSRFHSNDSVTSWATEIRSALHQLVTNQNLSGENGDVFALTSAIVGALECLQMQQSQLEESKAEQKTLLNQLGREKNSREEFELRSAVLEDEIEEMKRKQREVGEKARNDKRKLDLELINFKDTVSRLESQKKEVEKEVDGWRERYTKSMQRYMDDLNRLKTQQNMERESVAERDMNMMKKIRGRIADGSKGPYDSYEANFVLGNQYDEDEDLSSSAGMVKSFRMNSESNSQLNDIRGSVISINSVTSEVFKEGATMRMQYGDDGGAELGGGESNENDGTSTPCFGDNSGTPQRQHSPPPQRFKKTSIFQSEVKQATSPAYNDGGGRPTSMDLSMTVSMNDVNRVSVDQSLSGDDRERTVSVQSFEANNEPLFHEFQNMNQNLTPSAAHSSSSQDILCSAAASNWSSRHDMNSIKFNDMINDGNLDESFENWNYEEDENENALQRAQKDVLAFQAQGSNVSHASRLHPKFLEDQAAAEKVEDSGGQSGSNLVPLQLQGMNEEVQQLLEENSRLQETKNALNIVKDDLIAKVDQLTNEQEFMKEEAESLLKARDELQERLRHMDAEAKRLNLELEKTARESERTGSAASVSLADEMNSSVNISNEKKFTRREVSTLLMERNMYKERYLELQETVRWMGMMQAERSKHPDLNGTTAGGAFNSAADQRKVPNSGGIWKLFSGIFGSSSSGQNTPAPTKKLSTAGVSALKFDDSAPTVFTAVRATRSKSTANKSEIDKSRGDKVRRKISANSIAGGDQSSTSQMGSTAKANLVDGREEIYGWSVNASLLNNANLPNRSNTLAIDRTSRRPTTTRRATTMIPEHSAVDSSFDKDDLANQKELSKTLPIPAYSRPLMEKDPSFKNLSLQCACSVVLIGGQYSMSSSSASFTTSPTTPTPPDYTPPSPSSAIPFWGRVGNCSIVWLCSSSATCSRVSLFDLTSPAECISSLTFAHSQILTIHAVPGFSEGSRDLEGRPAESPGETLEANEGNNSYDQASAVIDFGSSTGSDYTATTTTNQEGVMVELNEAEDHLNDIADEVLNSSGSVSGSVSSPNTSVNKANRLPKCYWPSNVYSESDLVSSSKNPTVWIGCENGNLFVHSAVSDWNKCIHSVRLPSSVNTIDFVENRVFVGLSGGSVAVFYRDAASKEWDLQSYQLLDLGRPAHTVRCSVVAPAVQDYSQMSLWLGYRNKVHVVDPINLKIKASITAHVRRESQVRYMAVCGLGVWVSIRMESTLKLFHAITHQHLQDVNPEASIIRIIGQACRINFLRITSLSCIGNFLWIGTNVGVIVSLPVGEESQTGILSSGRKTSRKGAQAKPGGIVRVFNHSEETSPNQTTTALTSSTSSNERSLTSSSGNSGWDVQLVSNSHSNNEATNVPTTPLSQRSNTLMSPPQRSAPATSVVSNLNVPYCSLNQMRLSFHAHRHDVKFFVGAKQMSGRDLTSSFSSSAHDVSANEGDSNATETLHVMSGGRGYIDHRIGDKVEETEQNVPVVVSAATSTIAPSSGGAATLVSGAGNSPLNSSGLSRGANRQLAKSQRSHVILWKQDLSTE